MKKLVLIILCALMITASACSGSTDKATKDTAVTGKTDTSATASNTASTESAAASAQSDTYDPYATDNRYDIPASMFEKRGGVDYGRLEKDVTYYSQVAGDNKQVNVLLPAGFDESVTYPVMYVVHGFGGDHNSHLDTDSYLTLLYGNMLSDGLTVPMILVGVDMYTDKLADKDSKSDEELRFIYDKVIEEIHSDLMPFIEEKYPVSKERRDTAVAGMSEGGAKSLCIGFTWLDEFGWIGSFAPDTGVIPTEYYKGTFWNTPYMQEFPKPNENNTPYYLYMTVGTEDPWNIDCTLYYRDVLSDMGVKSQTDYVNGYGHDSDFWGQCFYNFLNKSFK